MALQLQASKVIDRSVDEVFHTARLASVARPGEVLVSESTFNATQIAIEGLENRELKLKGKSEPVTVIVLNVG